MVFRQSSTQQRCTNRMLLPTAGRSLSIPTSPARSILLEEAVAARVESFVYTSTTSVFGDALVPPQGAPAAWITEEVAPVPKNIYGVTKAAAEDLCESIPPEPGPGLHRAEDLAILS